MPDAYEGIEQAFRHVADLTLAPRLKCGLACSSGVYIGGERDVMRLRQIVYYVPDPNWNPVFVLDDHWAVIYVCDADTQWWLSERDFGEGWIGHRTQLNDLQQDFTDLLILRPPGESTAPQPQFLLRWGLAYPLTEDHSALYLLDGDRLRDVGPSDAFAIGDVIEHEGELWAGGWAIAETRSVQVGDTSKGFLPIDTPTTPSADPADPFVPTRGDANFHLYDFDTETWRDVGTQAQVCSIKPCIWRRDKDTLQWSSYLPNHWGKVRVWNIYSSTLPKPFRLTSTPYGVMAQGEAYVPDWHPVLEENGTPYYVAHPTYLIERSGYVRKVGYTAAIGDTGGDVVVIGPRSGWVGPPVRFVTRPSGQLIDPDRKVSGTNMVAAMTRDPRSVPVHWRGAFYEVWQLLAPDSKQFAIARIGSGSSTVVWARSDGAVWPQRNFLQSARLHSTPANLFLTRGLDVTHNPIGGPPDDPSREFVAVLNGLIAQSMTWDHRNIFLFGNDEEGEFAVGFDRTLYPYSSGMDVLLSTKWLTVRDLFDTDVDQRIPTLSWQVLQWPGRVEVSRVDVEWLWTPQYSEAPEVERVAVDWLWTPQYSEAPEVDAIALEWSDGLGANAPEVDSTTVDFSDGSGAEAPEVDSVAEEWSAGLTDPGAPDVDSVAEEWSDGSGTNEPEVDSVAEEWSAGIEDPGDDGAPEVDGVTAEWSDGSGAEASEVHTVRVEWSRAGGDPGVGEKYLVVTEVDNDRYCHAVRVSALALTPEQIDLCRVLVRADSDAATTAWASYKVGGLEEDIQLDLPGRAVRVIIVGPVALPDDTDFLVEFERS